MFLQTLVSFGAPMQPACISSGVGYGQVGGEACKLQSSFLNKLSSSSSSSSSLPFITGFLSLGTSFIEPLVHPPPYSGF